METKLHTLLAALKTLMLITPFAIVKTQKPHLMHDLIYVFHLLKKGKHKWGVATIKQKVQR
jgi:hypothetical protein